MSLLSAAADDEDGDTIDALRAAVQQACDWISEEPGRRPISAGRLLVTLTNALAAAPQSQGEQEPLAWIRTEWSSRNVTFDGPPAVPSVRDELTKPAWTPLYTRPQPKRQPLTEMEIVELRQLTPGTLDVQFVKFARTIERAHGIGGAA